MEIDREALLRAFLEESVELLAGLERAALDLGENPADRATVAEMFRCAHTLKGGASCVGLTAVTRLAHELENALSLVNTAQREVDEDLSTIALEVIDALRGRTDEASRGEAGEELADEWVFYRLGRWTRQVPAHGPASGTTRPGGGEELIGPPGRRTLRVDVDRLDRLLDLAGEIALAEGRLGDAVASGDLEATRIAFDRSRSAASALQEMVIALRLVPLAGTFERFRRPVRDLAEAIGKRARLVVEGGAVEVDTALAEELRDPLTHLVRNAIDHGIEAPDVRVRRGKDPMGTITLRARHEGSHVVVEVADDGAGIDAERLRRRAEELGVAGGSPASGAALLELAFTPGLSTNDAPTLLSGRGIGMDVVRRALESLRGAVSLSSEPGQGLRVSLRAPLTVGVVHGFTVSAGNETYVLPLDCVVECVTHEATAGDPVRREGVIELRGMPVPFATLGTRLDDGCAGPSRDRTTIVVIETAGRLAGLAVDAILGEVQTVIKPLGPLFAGLPGVSGSAVLGDGRVALVLDVKGLVRPLLS